MSKLARLWDWLRPDLICLCPMGAIVYSNGGAENEAWLNQSPRVKRPVPYARRGSVVISIARP